VDFNSTVTMGQVIALIDSTFLYASVSEAEANLERTRAQVNETRRNLNRTEELSKKDLVSQAELDAARTANEQAVAQFKQSQAALDRARVNLRYSVIRAPISGVVISRDVDVGQTVAASLQAPQLFVIANDLEQMQVEASVDEADIGQIVEGQPATFTVDAYPEGQFRGRVTQVRLAPVIVQNVVTYTVIIEVPNRDMKLRPGMTATVSILVDRRNEVVRVPALALRFQPPDLPEGRLFPQPSQGNASAAGTDRSGLTNQGGVRRKAWEEQEESKKAGSVWVLKGGTSPNQVIVELGLNDNRYVEVLGGDLKEGDEVVLGVAASESGAAVGGQTNPFAPRMPGRGRGRRF
jgi:HlyD family secretion protein